MKRRQFLKRTLIVGGALSLGGAFYWNIPFDEITENLTQNEYQFFEAKDLPVLLALIPVMLEGTHNPNINLVVKNMDSSILLLSQKSRQELRQLFDLLSQKLARVLATGIWNNWHEASAFQISHFLEQWRDSFLDLLQSGYQGLHQLVFGNYYADPSSWASLDYPGPPQITLQNEAKNS